MYEDQFYNHKEEKLAVAMELGYSDITEAIVGLYRKGSSSAKIARMFDVRAFTILNRLKKIKEPIRSRGGKNHKSKLLKQVARLGDTSNMTAKQLATKLNCNTSWIYTYGKKYNVKFKSIQKVAING